MKIKFSKIAFTIIELLITTGIILILVGISVQNYQSSSIRAKVSRVSSDLRTIEGAINVYTVDHSEYPRMAHFEYYRDPTLDSINGIRVRGVMSSVISTPIAYLHNSNLLDPFMAKNRDAPLDEVLYTYQVLDVYIERNPLSEFWPAAAAFYGGWRLGSSGPDLKFDHGFANSSQLPYDPSNGAISAGNLWRSEITRPGLPPIPRLLGAH